MRSLRGRALQATLPPLSLSASPQRQARAGQGLGGASVLEPEAPSSRHSSPVRTQHRQLPDEEQGGVGDEGKSDLASLAEVSGAHPLACLGPA